MLEQAREQCRAMVDEAQGLRARVLADLSKRRKVLHAQIEQLRAGRERWPRRSTTSADSVDTIASELFAAEDNARLAAEAAGREALDRVDSATPEELAAQLLADEPSRLAAMEAGADLLAGSEDIGATPRPRTPPKRVLRPEPTRRLKPRGAGKEPWRLPPGPSASTTNRGNPRPPRGPTASRSSEPWRRARGSAPTGRWVPMARNRRPKRPPGPKRSMRSSPSSGLPVRGTGAPEPGPEPEPESVPESVP